MTYFFLGFFAGGALQLVCFFEVSAWPAVRDFGLSVAIEVEDVFWIDTSGGVGMGDVAFLSDAGFVVFSDEPTGLLMGFEVGSMLVSFGFGW